MKSPYCETKPILITGSHRSGTTWVGKTLALSRSVGFIEEPFSPGLRYYDQGTCNAKFDYWWAYITEENESKFYDDLYDTFQFKYKTKHQIKRILENKCGFRTLLKGLSRSYYYRYFNRCRPLIKDPIALFSAEWLYNRFNMDVIVMIRHPAAFVSSIKRMNWSHDFTNFLNQPYLIRDHLGIFEDDIKNHIKSDSDIVDDAILLWRMFYYFVDKLRKKHQDFIFVKHEDLSIKPVERFAEIFKRLGIEFTEKIKKHVINSTNATNPIEAREGVMHHLKRNSRKNIKNWKSRLSNSEIIRIKKGVAGISELFYDEKDWV